MHTLLKEKKWDFFRKGKDFFVSEQVEYFQVALFVVIFRLHKVNFNYGLNRVVSTCSEQRAKSFNRKLVVNPETDFFFTFLFSEARADILLTGFRNTSALPVLLAHLGDL